MSFLIFVISAVVLICLSLIVFGFLEIREDKWATRTILAQRLPSFAFFIGLAFVIFFASLGFGLLNECVSDVIGDLRRTAAEPYVDYAISKENKVAFTWSCISFAFAAAVGISVSCVAKGRSIVLKKKLISKNTELENLREKEYVIENGILGKYQNLSKAYDEILQERNDYYILCGNLKNQIEELNIAKKQLENISANNERRDKLLDLVRSERDALKSKCEAQEYDLKVLNSKLQIEKVEKEIAQTQVSLYLSQEKQERKEDAERQAAEEMPALDDQENLRDYAFYEGIYDSFPSEAIKEKLDEIRNAQKNMIQEKIAAYCVYQFNVDGSIVEGKKVTKAVIKQAIGAFNAECDLLISQVKFYNIERIKNRIVWSYNKINKENEATNVEISERYLQLKLDEVSAVFEHARKKKEEADYAKEQRAIAREEARVMKELEEERARIEKEQTHYENRLARLEEQLAAEESDPRKELIRETITAVKEEIVDLDKALKEVDYRQANQRAGYVYVISNVGSFGEGVYKIGMTRRLQPEDRVDELGGASVPFRFDTHAMIFSKDAPALETALHNEFRDRRVNMINGRKEFFRVPLDEIERVVNKYHDKTVKFDYTPIAEQYRETQKLIERISV